MHDDPYAVGSEPNDPRASYPSAPYPSGIAPPVILWMRIYNGCLATLYLCIAALGVFMAVFGGSMPDTADEEAMFVGVLYGGLGLLFAPLYLYGAVLPRKGWVWVYAIVLLALSMTSCCCLPFAVPLLIFWIKPECKAWFEGEISN